MKVLQSKKFFITGASGQLATEFVRVFEQARARFFAPKETECDVTNEKQLKRVIGAYNPDIILNCAAYTDLETAEKDPSGAYLVNVLAVKYLADICKELKIFLVHYSSDYVFDGTKRDLYTEEDRPNPINNYGQSKVAGERRIQNILDDYLIFRMSWLIGRGKRNFIYKLNKWAETQSELRISSDEVSVPTFTTDAAGLTIRALDAGLKGIYHLVSGGCASRYELVKAYLKETGSEIPVIPISQDSFKLDTNRPRFSALSNEKLSRALGVAIPQWRDSLKRYIKEQEIWKKGEIII